jgi:hypothetical protein
LIVNRSLADPPGFKVTVEELNDVLGPDGETVTDRLTVPLNPFRLARDSVVFPDELRGMLIEEGFAEIEKSGARLTETWTVVEWDRLPAVPLIMAV